jgi:predicted nucleotidyltransferase
MIINLFDIHSSKILLFLNISPGSRYTRKELSEMTNINNVPLDNSLSKLLNLKLIIHKDKHYSLNIDNPIIGLILKETSEIKHLPLKIQYISLEFIQEIIKYRDIENVILFGSYAKLIHSDKSDIDIAIVTKDIKDTRKKILLISDKLSKKYKKELQIHFFTKEELKHKKDPLIKDILKNGRSLL